MLVRILLLGLLACVPASAQSLADVLSSVQERHQALEQRKQVEWYIHKNYTPESHPDNTAPAQNLISWTGLGAASYPTDADTASLSIEARIGLLNQAVKELRTIQRQYLNIRKEEITKDEDEETDEIFGAMRPYL